MLNSGVSLQRLATKAGVGFTPKKLFSNGEAGVWYDPSDVEASLTWRRNLLEYTESFDNSYYTGYFQKPTFTTGQADPLGGNNAMKWNASTTTGSSDGAKGGFYRPDNDGIIKPNTDYTVSVWLKATAPIAVSVGLMDGGYTTVTATTSWQRFSVTVQKSTNPVHGSRLIQIVEHTNADVDIYIFGAQTEEGSTATEYQPIRTTFDNAFKQAFPKHTLYQDEKGLTPVTGLGQSVGLMLDKSQGVAFGSQLVTTPNFDSATGWSTGTGHSITGGQLVYDGTGTQYNKTSTNISVTNGKLYKIVVDVASRSDSHINVGLADGAGSFTNPQNTLYTTGIHTIYQYADASSAKVSIQNNTATQTWAVNSITVEEVKGSHATQSDSTKRPVFARHPERGRVNLLKYTEEFDNGVWGKGRGTVQANTATAPDGTDTADTFTENTDNGSHYVVATLDCSPNTTFSASGYVKDKSTGFAAVGLQQNTSGSSYIGSTLIHFNLSTGTHTATANGGTEPTNISYSSESVGNGWYRIQVTGTLSGTAGKVQMFLSPSTGTTNSYQGDGSSGIYIWGAQLEEANEATGYQKVVDDYDITESGYKSVYYLQFDGVNDTMTVQPISNTTAPVSVFMGHDTEGNTGNNAYFLDVQFGRFILLGAKYYHGSAWVEATDVDPEAKGVTSVISDGTNADYRRDGIEETTGTLANKQLSGLITIFSRHDGTSYHTNGNMYQLVVRGATSTDKEIDQAEEFVAIKTGLKSEVVGLATLDLNFGANTYTVRNSNGSVL